MKGRGTREREGGKTKKAMIFFCARNSLKSKKMLLNLKKKIKFERLLIFVKFSPSRF